MVRLSSTVDFSLHLLGGIMPDQLKLGMGELLSIGSVIMAIAKHIILE